MDGVLTGASPGRLAAGAAAAVAVVVVAAVMLLRGPAPPPPELVLPLAGAGGDPSTSSTTLGSTTSSTTATEVFVHAAGAVGSPGVYRLAAGARVSDLLDVAGGPVPGADLDRLNLAAPLIDGERVFVPLPGQEVPAVAPSLGGGGAGDGGAATLRPEAPLDLNRATLDELDELPGVGPSTAQAIVDERERRGGFTAVDQLLEVRGIGDAKLAALRERVRV
ncbi:MAG: ComEA family DNA-binding protein [Actinomycetota bacterium]|nr:ComEA family DNA-binding protein [Actinomycetota bacterium]